MDFVANIDQYAKKDWWLFDTNCLSELVKLSNASGHKQIQRFIDGRYILLDPTNLLELSKTPHILEQIPETLDSAALVVTPTQTHGFVRRELFQLFGPLFMKQDPNPLGLLEVSKEFVKSLPEDPRFQDVARHVQGFMTDQFVERASPDIGAIEHPVDAYVHIWGKIDNYVATIIGADFASHLTKLPKTPTNFSSLFCFIYTYYFMYGRDAGVKVRPNDFSDLSFTSTASTCGRFYTERRLAYVMNQVKRTLLPSEREVLNRVYLKTRPELTRDERRRLTRDKSQVRPKLLQATEIYSLTDMRRHLGFSS